MRKLFAISAVIIALSFLTNCWKADSSQQESEPIETSSNDENVCEASEELRIDTIIYAKGHSFGFGGDISMWDGWFFDTICVGDDRMLNYDTVTPGVLKLDLVTKELTVDFGDPDASAKIINFMLPGEGYRRFKKSYNECIDSALIEGDRYLRHIGEVYFEVDYIADSCNENADKILRFLSYLSNISQTENVEMSALSAFYAGNDARKHYGPAYAGDPRNLTALAEFVRDKAYQRWIGECAATSQLAMVIRPAIVNERYATLSKYEYERDGFGHGMYTENFYTFNMKNGKRLRNKDIFKRQSLDKVKMRLFEVMAKDPHYRGGQVSPADIESIIKAVHSVSPALKGTEWEEPEIEYHFKLPDGALTDSGVIFSFKPYEIDGWSSGAYHFIVPYTDLMPYLTSKVKALIKD